MSIPLIINGQTFDYPVNFDEEWGIDATGWAQAVTNGMLQRAGGNFPLLADVNFGASFGLLSAYFSSRAANPSTVGTIRLASADAGIGFRNNANTGNLILTTNNTDQLTFNGSAIGFTGAVNAGTQYQLGYYATSSNVISSNPNTVAGTQVLVTDVHGVPTTTGNGGTTPTEIGYVHGVTSSIQPQINATVAVANAALPETGGTMSGVINMGANKISNLAAPTVTNDAVAYGQTFDVGSHKITGLANGTAATDAQTFGQKKYFQTVMNTSTTNTSSSSTTYVSVGLSVTITPTSASNRIKLSWTGSVRNSASGAFQVVQQITDGTNASGDLTIYQWGSTITSQIGFPVSGIWVASPATVSPVTYSLQMRVFSSSGGINFDWNIDNLATVMIAEEIV